jgi:hypothetical protein
VRAPVREKSLGVVCRRRSACACACARGLTVRIAEEEMDAEEGA